ncbi:PHA/PHB synthase family protein [Novosphingobium capsulatum]|uniref:PHA/PHB synthase family protein n=1 Tax=Novosphingobium capsulatum TaxID=13688 RepID=UPI00078813FF|nr:class I poly(R)-hydroxyalkanoic acid synthase [Novosphingobium capsulatum]WQD93190.1 class I poly(R)-hydroxyalkanoic acid synthase [Novosphingobium capsulatum]
MRETGNAKTPVATDNAVFEDLFRLQAEAMQALAAPFLPTAHAKAPDPGDFQHWAMSGAKLQKMWLDFMAEQTAVAEPAWLRMVDGGRWKQMFDEWAGTMPITQAETQARLWDESLQLWNRVIELYAPQGAVAAKAPADVAPDALPRRDRRFADPRWREQPWFALLHQTYLLLAERLEDMAQEISGLEPERHGQVRFMTRLITEALSPANFPMTNPLVIERTLATRGENLVKGVEHLLADLRRGQLSHTDGEAFEVGRNIATTAGKVVHETPLFQLIHYTPTTDQVAAVPLLIFPPWINRFYILDLNPKKSFVSWALDQGLSVFMVSWKSADASMADVTMDDYVRAQIEAIDVVRQKLAVPKVHTIGYCVAGTTLAATLAVLARRGEADKVASATFFTAQVDFSEAGELCHFVDDAQLRWLESLETDGYLDGRYLAATFNLLRGPDLIWNYVINNYLLGEDYLAFDLLYWNGDTTNLPARWHRAYLSELYRDNQLVVPDALSADGTPIDLHRITTPCYIQAGREDHIAPANSVWKLTRHLAGPWKFVLAGSGHIAGVVNPPAAGKYQYWTNPGEPASLEAFVAGAQETKGSWWPDWRAWLADLDGDTVPAKGARVPGRNAIEDAPGRYVRMR